MEKVKKQFNFPSAFTILFIILIIAVVLTWVVPAGSYSKLTYDNINNVFVVKAYQQEDVTYPATEESLEKLKIKIDLKNFTEGPSKSRLPFLIPISEWKTNRKASAILPSAWYTARLKPLTLWSSSLFWGA